MSTSVASPSLSITDEGSEKMTELDQIRQEYTELQAAYKTLADRLHNGEQDENKEREKELQSLRDRVKELEANVASITAENDELNSTVRDLRVRVEEGRRAIMRLQGQSGSSTGQEGLMPSSNASSASNLASVAAQKQENRKSTGLGVLSSWNPREIGNGQSPKPDTVNEGGLTSPPAAAQTVEELAELKKSKRASLAFGPHAHGNNTMRRMQGHRRIASGSRIGEEEDAQSMPPPSHPPSAAGGLRELHLGGAPGSGTTNANPDRSSKRISILGGAFLRSPNPEAVDPSIEGSPERLQAGVSLLMPSKGSRRTSNSSAISNSNSGIAQLREDAENTLAPPRSLSRMSQSPSQASVSSPILENVDMLNEFDSEPSTARANTTAGFAQQQSTASTSTYQLQRSLMESKAKLRDRDDQVTLLKRELAAIKNQLDEAKDAREASEACLAALREFVKADGSVDSENGGEQTAKALKGMKLPPLPTDKDADEMEGSHDHASSRSGQSTAPSAWRSIGNTFAGLTRKQTESYEANSSNPSYSPTSEKMLGVKDLDGASEATSPTSQISSSISNFWSKATTKAESGAQGANAAGDGTTGSSTTPSEGTSGGENRTDSRHTSIHSNATAGEQASASATSPLNPGFKGFGWFAKRTVSNASDTATPANTTEVRVSSPPFANLDNHVLTLDQVSTPVAAGRAASYASLTGTNTSGTPGSRKTSATSNMSFGSSNAAAATAALQNGIGMGITGDNVGPNGRVKKAMEMSEAVDEDSGFVPPSFTS